MASAGRFWKHVRVLGLRLNTWRSGTARVTLPLAIVIVGWIFAGYFYISFRKHERISEQAHFDAIVGATQVRLEQQLEAYKDVVRGAAQFLTGATKMDNEMWKAYVQRLHFQERYPYSSAMSISVPASTEELPALELRQRALGFPTFRVHAPPLMAVDGSVGEHFIILYMEPLTPTAIGADHAMEPHRRAAILRARDTGELVITEPTTVLREGIQSTAFLLFMPVYRAGSTLDTVADRRAALKAIASATFTPQGFFDSVLRPLQGQLIAEAFIGPIASAKIGRAHV